ncbi:MAG TPA: Na+/H+ antiporter NhaA [Kofleriaceae bacterium]|nr:Na+/H+ antiporter NhaA [Kofleriaceae bacterium]
MSEPSDPRDDAPLHDGVSPRLIDPLVRPFQVFSHNKVAGALLLMAATVAALVWANSPWSDSYNELLGTNARVGLGDFEISKPLLLWVNDGLMAIFFFVVGLEIKREVLDGELSSPRQAALPIAAAFGGMVVPALVYLAFNAGKPGEAGWGIPMATDIAFALGVLLLLGPRVPMALKIFLTALAIVDDIGAIVVIAVFYTDSIALGSLAIGGIGLLVSIAANITGVRNPIFYFIVGTVVWIGFLKSGVHATLAAVLMAMTIPATTRINGRPLMNRLASLLGGLRDSGLQDNDGTLTEEQHHALQSMERTIDDATAPLADLEHALMPVVTLLVLPIFALANAGVALGGNLGAAFADPVCLGIIAGLFVGKQIGIVGCALLAVKLGWADLPRGVTWAQIHAVSILAGIGFTMSIFIAGLAFSDPAMQETAKVGIMSASLLSATVGGWLLVRSQRKTDLAASTA